MYGLLGYETSHQLDLLAAVAEFGTAPTVQLPALLLEARPVSGTPASTVNKGNGIPSGELT